MLKSRRCKCFKWGSRTPEKKWEIMLLLEPWKTNSTGKSIALRKWGGTAWCKPGKSLPQLALLSAGQHSHIVIVFVNPHWQMCASFHKVTQLWGFMSSHSKGEFPVRETPFKKEILDLGTQGDIHGTGRTLDWREDIMRGRSLENKESKLFL